jgi:hypothetical protein
MEEKEFKNVKEFIKNKFGLEEIQLDGFKLSEILEEYSETQQRISTKQEVNESIIYDLLNQREYLVKHLCSWFTTDSKHRYIDYEIKNIDELIKQFNPMKNV